MKKKTYSSLTWTGILVTLIAITINLIIYYLARYLGEEFIIPFSDQSINGAPMPVIMVVITTIIPSFLAILLYGALKKIISHGFIIPFLSVSITALIVSFGGPASLPGASYQTKLALISMHIFSGMIIIGGIIFIHRLQTREIPSAKK